MDWEEENGAPPAGELSVYVASDQDVIVVGVHDDDVTIGEVKSSIASIVAMETDEFELSGWDSASTPTPTTSLRELGLESGRSLVAMTTSTTTTKEDDDDDDETSRGEVKRKSSSPLDESAAKRQKILPSFLFSFLPSSRSSSLSSSLSPSSSPSLSESPSPGEASTLNRNANNEGPSSRRDSTFTLHVILDERSSFTLKPKRKEFNLKVSGRRTISQIKGDVAFLTGIPAGHQSWAGFPSPQFDQLSVGDTSMDARLTNILIRSRTSNTNQLDEGADEGLATDGRTEGRASRLVSVGPTNSDTSDGVGNVEPAVSDSAKRGRATRLAAPASLKCPSRSLIDAKRSGASSNAPSGASLDASNTSEDLKVAWASTASWCISSAPGSASSTAESAAPCIKEAPAAVESGLSWSTSSTAASSLAQTEESFVRRGRSRNLLGKEEEEEEAEDIEEEVDEESEESNAVVRGVKAFCQNRPNVNENWFSLTTLRKALNMSCGAPITKRKPLILFLYDKRSDNKTGFSSKIFEDELVGIFMHEFFILWFWDATTMKNKNKLKNKLRLIFGETPLIDNLTPENLPAMLFFVRQRGFNNVVAVLNADSASSTKMLETLAMTLTMSEEAKTSDADIEKDSEQRQAVINAQDAEFQESLLLDAEKERMKEEMKKCIDEMLEEASIELESLLYKEQVRLVANEIFQEFLPEPQDFEITLSIRLMTPGGSVLTRKFKPSDPVWHFYQFAASQGFPASRFRFLRGFPRRDLETTTSGFLTSGHQGSLWDATFGEVAIGFRETWFVVPRGCEVESEIR